MEKEDKIDYNRFETIYLQLKTDLLTKTQLLKKVEDELVDANSKISELTKEFDSIENENIEMTNHVELFKNYIKRLENDNNEIEISLNDDVDKVKNLKLENDNMLIKIRRQEIENEELNEKLDKINEEIKNDSCLIEEITKSDEKLREICLKIGNEIRYIDKRKIEILNNEKYLKISEKSETFMKNYEKKFDEIKIEREEIRAKLLEIKTKRDILKNSLATENMEKSNFNDFLFKEFQKSGEIFLEKSKTQQQRLIRLENFWKKENETGEKLEMLLKNHMKIREKLKEKCEIKKEEDEIEIYVDSQ